jgi:hypothetical protein
MHDEAVALLGAISGRISMRISRLTEIKKEEEVSSPSINTINTVSIVTHSHHLQHHDAT